jgi:hypothetical protein
MNSISQSFYDSLMNQLTEDPLKRDKDYVSPEAARLLYNVWSKGRAKDAQSRLYGRPYTISVNDIDTMQKEGLINKRGENIELTSKGSKTIKIMVLGDDRSVFDKNDIVIDYTKALSSCKGVKTAKKIK